MGLNGVHMAGVLSMDWATNQIPYDDYDTEVSDFDERSFSRYSHQVYTYLNVSYDKFELSLIWLDWITTTEMFPEKHAVQHLIFSNLQDNAPLAEAYMTTRLQCPSRSSMIL